MAESGSLAAKAAARALHRDHIIRCFTPSLRLALVQATHSVNDGIQRHNVTNYKASRLYGRTLLATSLMSSMLKGEERTIVQFLGDSDDDITRIYAEVMAIGEVRGFITGPGISKTLAPGRKWWDGKLRPSSASLSVSKILYNHATPVQSITALQEGDVESDLAHWFAQSEQLPTSLRLEVLTDPETGKVHYAGGVLLQHIAQKGGTMPDSAVTSTFESVSARLARRLPIDALELPGYTDDQQHGQGQGIAQGAGGGAAAVPVLDLHEQHSKNERASHAHCGHDHGQDVQHSLSGELRMAELHAQGVSLTSMARSLLPELADAPGPAMESGRLADEEGKPSPFYRIPLDFRCRCNKDKFTEGLARLGLSLLEKMKDDYCRDHPAHAGTGPGSTGSGGALPPVTTLTCQFCNAAYGLHMADMEKACDTAKKMTVESLVSSSGTDEPPLPFPTGGRPAGPAVGGQGKRPNEPQMR